MQRDGQVVLGGDFDTVNGVAQARVARLNSDGTLDPTFSRGLAGADGTVNALAVQDDGNVLIGGYFTNVHGVARNRLARLLANGTPDPGFLEGLAGADNAVFSVVARGTGGQVMVGGDFHLVNGVAQNRIAWLNADGALYPGFLNGLAGVNGTVFSATAQTGRKVLVGGQFSSVNGVPRNNLARFNADGTLDAGFLSELAQGSGSVFTVAAQPDEKVLIGGSFPTVSGVVRNGLARLHADGTLDTDFLNGLAGPNLYVYAIAPQNDGKVVIGGGVTSVNGVERKRIARLNADGTLDPGFLDGLAGADASVYGVAVQTDGKVLIGGSFTSVPGAAQRGWHGGHGLPRGARGG